MKRCLIVFLLLLIVAFALSAGGKKEDAEKAAAPAYELIKWNSPKPISQRISGTEYVLPDGWKEATEGVRQIKVSNFGALQHDPATVANAKRFGELTGIQGRGSSLG
jgi:hypothetical protein